MFILYWKDVKTANSCFIVLGNLLGNFVTNLNVFRMSYNHNAFRNQYPKPRALHNGYNILRGVIYAYKKISTDTKNATCPLRCKYSHLHLKCRVYLLQE